jgi:hypothetical protein
LQLLLDYERETGSMEVVKRKLFPFLLNLQRVRVFVAWRQAVLVIKILEHYPNKWIGRGDPTSWPTRSRN